MGEPRTTLVSKITPYLGHTEKIFLVGLTLGLMSTSLNSDNKTILQVSVVGLGITYFLLTFKMMDFLPQEGEMSPIMSLLVWTIAPKNLWMFSAISLFGLFVYTLQLGNDGYQRAFMVGGLGIASCLTILGYAYVTGTKHLKYVLSPVIRAVPLLFADFYLLYN
jgi:hypothetical protein